MAQLSVPLCALESPKEKDAHQKSEITKTEVTKVDVVKVEVTVAPKQEAISPVELGDIRSEPLDGQYQLDIRIPDAGCPMDEKLARIIKACVKIEPSPIGNIVLDAGHFIGSNSDRSGSTKDNIHEGNLNMAVTLMSREILNQCYNLGPQFVKLMRYPWDTEFGEYHNKALAQNAVDKWKPNGVESTTIASLYEGDSPQRKAFARFLLGNGSDEIEEKSSYWQIHANHATSKMDFEHDDKKYTELSRKADHLLALYSSTSGNEKDKATAEAVIEPMLLEMSPTIIKIRKALELKVVNLPDGSKERAEMQSRLDYFMRDVKPKSQSGFSRGEARELAMVSRDNDSSWNGLKASVTLVEGIYMNGYMAELANYEIERVDNLIRERVNYYDAIKDSATPEMLEAAKISVKDAMNGMVQVREKVYDAKTGQWVITQKNGYHAPIPYVDYARGLSRGIANSYKEVCEKAGVNAG